MQTQDFQIQQWANEYDAIYCHPIFCSVCGCDCLDDWVNESEEPVCNECFSELEVEIA